MKHSLLLPFILILSSCVSTNQEKWSSDTSQRYSSSPDNYDFVSDSMDTLSQNGRTLPSSNDVNGFLGKLTSGPSTHQYCPEINQPQPQPQPQPPSPPPPPPPPSQLYPVGQNDSELLKNYKKLGGNPKAFQQAMCFYDKNLNTEFKSGAGGKIKITDECKIIINDYSKPSSVKRVFILNKCTGEVKAMQSSHGSGGASGAQASTNEFLAQTSNENGTKASPSGFFILGDWHTTQKSWGPGIKMHGLEKDVNDKAYARGVVLHRSMGKSPTTGQMIPYCGGGIASSSNSNPVLGGRACGRTWGCLGIPPENWSTVTSEMKGTKNGGPLSYTFTADREAKMPDSWCGGELWQ